MVDSQYLDWLTWRAHLFERCYLKGFNNILLNVTLDTDDALNRHIHSSDGDEIQRRLDRAEERMRQNVDKLRTHYAKIPFEDIETDPYASHISVLKDLVASSAENIKSIVYYQPSGQEARPKYASFEKGMTCSLDSLTRCMGVEGIESHVLSDMKANLPVMASTGRMIAQSKSARDELGKVLVNVCDDLEKMLSFMLSSRACDTGFAPLVVTRYVLEDYDYWVGELLQNRTEEAYDKVNMISGGLRQIGYLNRAKFDFVVKKLQSIKGQEDFEVIVKDSNENSFAARDVNNI